MNKKKYHKKNREQINEYQKEYYKGNKNNIKDKKREDYLENKGKILEQRKEYYQINKLNPRWLEKKKRRGRVYKENNKEKIREYSGKYRKKNKDAIKEYYQKNKEKRKIKDKIYFQENKDKIYNRIKIKKKNDKSFKISCNLRKQFWTMFKFYTKTGKIMSSKKYGINYKAIIEHLKPFPKDLPHYEIDHIRPLCSFTFVNKDGDTNVEEVKKAFSPENHQWLLVGENRSKGGRW